jgi:hypothetical protein
MLEGAWNNTATSMMIVQFPYIRHM